MSLPVSVADARTHLRIHSSVTSEDARIERLIKAATSWVQQWTCRRLVTQSITELLDAFPRDNFLCLHVYPINSLVIKYDDPSDVEQTLSGSGYWTHMKRLPPGVEVKNSWPATMLKAGAVRIECEVGQAVEDVPADLKEAVLHIVEHLYENPGLVLQGSASVVPMGALALLRPYRI